LPEAASQAEGAGSDAQPTAAARQHSASSQGKPGVKALARAAANRL
jgi:hypothetical protein